MPRSPRLIPLLLASSAALGAATAYFLTPRGGRWTPDLVQSLVARVRMVKGVRAATRPASEEARPR